MLHYILIVMGLENICLLKRIPQTKTDTSFSNEMEELLGGV